MGNIFSMYQISEQELKRQVKDLVVALQLEDETKPTVKELDDKLGNLVDWERFALHLPQTTQKNIDMIKRDNPLNTASQKQALFDKWLRLYPNASWKHVIVALETVGENDMAQAILQCLPEAAFSSKEQLTPHEETIQEATLLTLSELHRIFAELSFECQRALKKLVQNKIVTLSDLVDRVKTEGAYKFEDLDGIKDSNQFFTVISQHYHFLDTHLLVVLVQQFLNPSEILEKLLAHVENTKAFKEQTEIRSLHKTLEPFVIKTSNEAPVTIRVQSAWEHIGIWLVETLLKTLFNLKDKEIPKCFRVIPGSLTIIFLVPQHKILHLTELSQKKVQFLRLTGVFTLQVGERYILQDEENEAYSFTQALIEAKKSDNYQTQQAVQFLVQVQQYQDAQQEQEAYNEGESEDVVEPIMSSGDSGLSDLTTTTTDHEVDEVLVSHDRLRFFIMNKRVSTNIVPILLMVGGLPDSGKTIALRDFFNEYKLSEALTKTPVFASRTYPGISLYELVACVHDDANKVQYASIKIDTCYLYAVYSVLHYRHHLREQTMRIHEPSVFSNILFNDDLLDLSFKSLFERLKKIQRREINLEHSRFFRQNLRNGVALINVWNVGLSKTVFYFLPFLSGQLTNNYLWLFFDYDRDIEKMHLRPDIPKYHHDHEILMLWRSRLYYLLRHVYFATGMKKSENVRCSIFSKAIDENCDKKELIEQFKEKMMASAKEMKIEHLIDPNEIHIVSSSIVSNSRSQLLRHTADKIVTEGFKSPYKIRLSWIFLRDAFYEREGLYVPIEELRQKAAKLNIKDKAFIRFCTFFSSFGSIIDASKLGPQSPYIITKPMHFFAKLDELFYFVKDNSICKFGLLAFQVAEKIFGDDVKFFMDVLVSANLAVKVKKDQLCLPPSLCASEPLFYIPIASQCASFRECKHSALHLQITGQVLCRNIQVKFAEQFLTLLSSAKIDFSLEQNYTNCTYYVCTTGKFRIVCHGNETEFIMQDDDCTLGRTEFQKAVIDSCYNILTHLIESKTVLNFNFSFLCFEDSLTSEYQFNKKRHFLPLKDDGVCEKCKNMLTTNKVMEIWNDILKKDKRWQQLPENKSLQTEGNEVLVSHDRLRNLILNKKVTTNLVPILLTVGGLPDSGKTIALHDLFNKYNLSEALTKTPVFAPRIFPGISWYELVACGRDDANQVQYASVKIDTCYLHTVYSVLHYQYRLREQTMRIHEPSVFPNTLFNDDLLDLSFKSLFEQLEKIQRGEINLEHSRFFRQNLPNGVALINVWNVHLSKAVFYFLPFLSGQLTNNYLWLFFDHDRDIEKMHLRPDIPKYHHDHEILMLWRSRLYYLLRHVYFTTGMKKSENVRCSIFSKAIDENCDKKELIEQFKEKMMASAKEMKIEHLIDPNEIHMVSSSIVSNSRSQLLKQTADKIVTEGFKSPYRVRLSWIFLRDAFYEREGLYVPIEEIKQKAATLNIKDKAFIRFCTFFSSFGSIIDASQLGPQSPYIITKPMHFFAKLDELFYFDTDNSICKFGLLAFQVAEKIFGDDVKFFMDVLVSANLAFEVKKDQLCLPPSLCASEPLFYIPIASQCASFRECKHTALHLQITGQVLCRNIQVKFAEQFLTLHPSAKINFSLEQNYTNCTYYVCTTGQFKIVCHGNETEFIMQDDDCTLGRPKFQKAVIDSCYNILTHLIESETVLNFNFSFLCSEDSLTSEYQFNKKRHFLPLKDDGVCEKCKNMLTTNKVMEIWNDILKKDRRWQQLPENESLQTEPISSQRAHELAEALGDLSENFLDELAVSLNFEDGIQNPFLKGYTGWRRIMIMVLEWENKSNIDDHNTFLLLKRKLTQLSNKSEGKDKSILQNFLKKD